MMDFERFTKDVADNIKMFLPPEYADADVELKKVIKNNDMELTGIMIHRDDNNITPNIYLDGYYDRYVDGAQMEDIMQAIADVRVRSEVEKGFDVSMITDLDHVKDKIVCKLINEEMNAEYLKDKPHTQFEDLAVIYSLDLGGSEHGRMSTAITNSLMQQYGLSTEELHKIAMDNLANSQIEFKTMREVLMDMMFPGGVNPDDPRAFMLPPEDEGPSMYILSNSDKINGATAILDSKTMEDISEKLGGDFIVLPSSIHEVIIVPANDEMDRHTLEGMVRDVNTCELASEERLSDNVYMYDSKEHELILAAKMEERQQQRAEAMREEKEAERSGRDNKDVRSDMTGNTDRAEMKRMERKADREEKKPERVSMKSLLSEKKAEVAKNEATRQPVAHNRSKEAALA
ncbi:MAG: DUF5688 family protein [Lachnospiraceae bacterium]|nr:DUF5688 family protein [Lachnospiraceae bacterium]